MMAKISTAVTVIRFLYEIIMGVRDLVQMVEEDDIKDGEKHGKEKKETVLDLVAAVYDAADQALDLPIDRQTVLDLADKAIELFVKFYNAIGKFRSKSD